MQKIEVTISDNTIVSKSDIAGVMGSSVGSTLVLRFGESWKGLTKRLIFTNARGLNPVIITLGIDSLTEDDNGQLLNYEISVPGEALEFSGDIIWLPRALPKMEQYISQQEKKCEWLKAWQEQPLRL